MQKQSNSSNIMKRINKKYSHLYLQEKNLRSVPNMNPSTETSVIYMYKNFIKTIENLEDFTNLTCLYLQNNDIEKIENLRALKKLKKLYLGGNRISILEGLQTNMNLEVLHMENQNLPEGTPLCFDPRSVFALSRTLRVLNISNNNITSLSCLAPLKNLRHLDASKNDLDDVNEVCGILSEWYHLQDANFRGNVFTKQHRYRDKIIGSSMSLMDLDGKEISNVTRVFMRRFEHAKLVRSKQSVTT